MPPFVIQPLVENALKHGLGSRTERAAATCESPVTQQGSGLAGCASRMMARDSRRAGGTGKAWGNLRQRLQTSVQAPRATMTVENLRSRRRGHGPAPRAARLSDARPHRRRRVRGATETGEAGRSDRPAHRDRRRSRQRIGSRWNFARQRAPDVILLDIAMREVDGFDRRPPCLRRGPLIIFQTAHHQFALRAFEHEALDYVVKPIRKERLAATRSSARGAGSRRPCDRHSMRRRWRVPAPHPVTRP